MRMEEKEGPNVFFGRTRYVILLLSHLCLTFAFSNSLVFNFTIICMQNETSLNWLDDSANKNALFSAVGLGCLIGTLPMSFLVQKYGIGKTCSLYGAISGIATLLFPFAVDLGFSAVFIARVLQGIPTSLSYPATGQIASQWATEKGGGAFIAILSSHIQFCSIFTMPVSGALCNSSWGWRGDYFLHGFISLGVFFIFFLFYHDNPQFHKTVSSRELERINRGKGQPSDSNKIPYKLLATDPCCQSIWLSTVGGTLGFQCFLLYGPLYMNQVLGMDVASTGMATALPFLLSAIGKFILGPLSDKITCISHKTRFICFAALSQGVMAICFVIMSMTDNAIIAQIAYTAAIVFSGANAVGTVKCAQMRYRQYVHIVLSVASLALVLDVFFLPVLVHLACPNNAPSEVRLPLDLRDQSSVVTSFYHRGRHCRRRVDAFCILRQRRAHRLGIPSSYSCGREEECAGNSNRRRQWSGEGRLLLRKSGGSQYLSGLFKPFRLIKHSTTVHSLPPSALRRTSSRSSFASPVTCASHDPGIVTTRKCFNVPAGRCYIGPCALSCDPYSYLEHLSSFFYKHPPFFINKTDKQVDLFRVHFLVGVPSFIFHPMTRRSFNLLPRPTHFYGFPSGVVDVVFLVLRKWSPRSMSAPSPGDGPAEPPFLARPVQFISADASVRRHMRPLPLAPWTHETQSRDPTDDRCSSISPWSSDWGEPVARWQRHAGSCALSTTGSRHPENICRRLLFEGQTVPSDTSSPLKCKPFLICLWYILGKIL